MTVSLAPTTRSLSHRGFRAMTTDVELLLHGDPAVFESAEQEVHRLEHVFSRFRPDSELSRLNAARRAIVSRELFDVVEAALVARELTGGRFDPTVHNALVAAGYDRTFDAVGSAAAAQPPASCCGAVWTDAEARHVELAAGVRLDLGGIAKGYIVDRLCDLIEPCGPCLVNAGGDLAVRGLHAGEPWPVAVELAGGSMVVTVAEGALATSGVDRRRWIQGGAEQHHLIDPRTSRPAETDLLRVTVAAATAIEAEVWAKALLLAGETAAAAEAAALELPCVLVTADGRVRLEGGLG
jgi:thiamine biosynthesis lipoprotein